MKRTPVLLLLIMLSAISLQAQDLKLRAEADSTRFLIGEWISLHLEVDAPDAYAVVLPATDEDLVNAEFVSAEAATVSESSGRRRFTQDVIVSVFDTGRIPVSVIVRYTVPGDTTKYSAQSDPIAFDITTVPLDTTITFKDIREVIHVPLTIWDYLMYAGIGLLLLLLAWLAYRWWRERNGEEVAVVNTEPPLPADVVALQALEALRAKALWQNGKHKEYQSRLTDILRGYIEHRFDVPALEQPTSEIMPDVAMLGLPTDLVGELDRLLRIADMCKFARYVPSSAEHETGMECALRFVRDTRPTASEASKVTEGGQAHV